MNLTLQGVSGKVRLFGRNAETTSRELLMNLLGTLLPLLLLAPLGVRP